MKASRLFFTSLQNEVSAKNGRCADGMPGAGLNAIEPSKPSSPTLRQLAKSLEEGREPHKTAGSYLPLCCLPLFFYRQTLLVGPSLRFTSCLFKAYQMQDPAGKRGCEQFSTLSF